MSWWTGRPSRRELETEVRNVRRALGDTTDALADAEANLYVAHAALAERDARLAEYDAWYAEIKPRIDAWEQHTCTPAVEPTVLEVTRLDHPVYDAEVVEEQPALFFSQLGGEYLSKPRDHWMRTGMTTEIRRDDPKLQAVLAEAEHNRGALVLVDSADVPEATS